MGIHGLLPFLKKASREVDIRNYSGATVAVDAYCWLHKGAFSCAEKLGKGEPTDGYIHYCMKMINVLIAANVKPILVFDGQNLPSKSVTETKRRQNREKHRKLAKQYLREGKLKEARDCFQKTVDITPEMAHEVILACRSKNVDCIVAPYEADAQLAYLNQCGVAQIIITEDSDLVLFGCEKVIFKMDVGGRGIMVEKSAIVNCLGARPENFTFEKFRYMCILSGCDYLPSLPGIGLAKAFKFFNLITNPDVYKALGKIPSYLKMPNLVVPVDYKEGFVRANNTFLYQIVFCPRTKKLVPLTPYAPDIDYKDMLYAGKYLPEDVALQLAFGNINIHTMKYFENAYPKEKRRSLLDTKGTKENHTSIWDENYQTPKKTTAAVKNSPLSPTKEITSIVQSDIFNGMATPRKREREQKSFDAMTDQEIEAGLTITSASPSYKKSKSYNNETEKSTSTSCKKTIFLRESKSAPEVVVKKLGAPIIRSRFFVSDSDVKEMPMRTASWLDAIDAEYGVGVPSKTKSIDTSSKSPFRTLDKKIIQSNHDKATEMNKSSPAEHQRSENLQEFSHTRISTPKFKWRNPLTVDHFRASNGSIQNSPKCESHFKPVLPTNLSLDSIHNGAAQCRESQTCVDEDAELSNDSSEEFDSGTMNNKFGRKCASPRIVTNKLVPSCVISLDDDDQEVTCDILQENMTTSDHVQLKEKIPQNNKRRIGSRCPGLRKRHTQPSIKDMLTKFSFERTSKQLQK